MISIRKPIMSVNPLNVELPDNMEEPEKCGICQEALSSAQSYTLPECKHKFHTHCIITWFRTRPPADDSNGEGGRCPYCGNRGINNKARSRGRRRGYYYGHWYRYDESTKQKLAMMRQEVRKASAPKQLVQLFAKYRIKKNEVGQAREAYSAYKESIKNTSVNYADCKKNLRILRTTLWRKQRVLNAVEDAIVDFPIIPLIIPVQVDLS